MNWKGFTSFFVIMILLASGFFLSPGCANIVPPSGGPRDSIPPVLLKASPADSTRNFTGTRIVLTFDEFVDVMNAQQNLVVSPIPRSTPTVDYRLNTVTIRLRDSLEPNTTYALNFGDAIKDYTEGNPIKGFTYTFSTGRYIDSLELTGNVILAETGKIDTTLIVMLHTSANDSAVKNERPRYITKLDNQGRFTFRNLPPKTFYLYALKDDGGTYRYMDKKNLFAFASAPVMMDGKMKPVTLYAYAEKDTAFQNAPSTRPVSSNNGKNKNGSILIERLKYQTNLQNNFQDLLGTFIMTFETPLKFIDTNKLRLFTDSIYSPVQDSSYSFRYDSVKRQLRITTRWIEGKQYHLVLQKDFAEDRAGLQLVKTDTLTFMTKKRSDYGSLKLSFKGLDLKKNPVLYFIINDALVRSVPLGGTTFSEVVFPPGDYELRILYDENKNGVWDAGDFFGRHRQPEIVVPVGRRITVKSSWENEIDIQL